MVKHENERKDPAAGWRARIVIRQGDLTDAAVDAIVNAANTDLIMGAGVAGAIRSRGGPEIQAECDRIGPIPLGEAGVTSGGRLRARYVIHAAGMYPGGRATEQSIRDAVRNSLARASEHRLESIALPAIGTGVAGFPVGRCAEAMIEEIRAHLAGGTSLERIEVVLFDRPALAEFERALAELSG